VIQAAIDGQGVALGREPLIDRLIRQRKLVAPFPDRYATPRAYYIVRAPHAALRPEAQAFSDWLQEEARADAVESEAASAPRSSAKRARAAS
jgi:DNA-binding transcriptional LysR family regulator